MRMLRRWSPLSGKADCNMTKPESGALGAALSSGDFIVTAEITPKLTASATDVLEQARPLRDKVTAVNVTDGAGARVTMSSLAASALLARAGIEPILQMTCRDRNRIAIAADLLGAAALGINNVLVLSGDNPGAGDEPDACGVFDYAAIDVMRLARRMADEGKTNSDRELLQRPSFIVGGVDAPFDPPADWQPDKLLERADAGMAFIQTQFCYEPDVTARYLARLSDSGLLEKASIILGVGPLASLRSARWMNEHLFGVSIPEAVLKRMDAAKDEAQEGHRICVELIQQYREMPGAAGVHIMAPAQSSERIAGVIDAALPG